MRTTIILKDELYAELIQQTITAHGSARKLSETINDLLSKCIAKSKVPKSMFGTMKPFDLSDVRDKSERI